MPRYFFHAEDGQCYPDEDGADLPDLKSAAAMALRVLAEHLENSPKDFWAHDCLLVHLDSATGMRLLTLSATAIYSASAGLDGGPMRPDAVKS